MSATARYIVEAVIRERRSPVELARTHKVSRSWIYNQLERFHRGGYEALAPRSRRPRSSANQVDSEVQQLIAKLRRKLFDAGHDAGPQTIHYHLSRSLGQPPSVAHHHRGRRVNSRPDPRPQSQLPTPRWSLACPQCLATGVHHVVRHDIGGPEGIRTPDLLSAIQARSQLRHRPTR